MQKHQKMSHAYAYNLVHQFGSMEAWDRASEIASYMVEHDECVAHAAYVILKWDTCPCSPCRKERIRNSA